MIVRGEKIMAPTTTQVLEQLDGWEITDPENTTQEEETVYTITEEKITSYISKATKRAAAHIQITDLTQLPTGDIIDEAIATWTAGLLWNMKYSTEAPSYSEDKKGETYGDKKIIEAKEMLDTIKKDPDGDGDARVKIGIITIGGRR